MDGDLDEEAMVNMYSGVPLSVLVMLMTFMRRMQNRYRSIHAGPSEDKIKKYQNRKQHMDHIYNGFSDSCVNYVRMHSGVFMKLAEIMRRNDLLRDSRHVTVEEQLAMTLNILGHKTKNRSIRSHFIRSGETVSRYFNKVLEAICLIRSRFLRQAQNEVPQEILSNPLYYPYFKDCIGMIDGTHVDAMLPANLQPRFRGRKGVTQNVLADCTPNKLFTYVLAGWEGSANDFRVLQDALSRLQPHGLKVYDGKYYLCDAGYTTMPGFISSMREIVSEVYKWGKVKGFTSLN